MEELPRGGSRTPADDLRRTGAARLVAPPDQGGNDMARGGVEVVPRTVEIHRHHHRRSEPVLPPVGIEHHEQRLLGDAVRCVRDFWITVPEVVLPERNGTIPRIRADGAGMDELLEPDPARMLDEMEPHRHVGVEKTPRCRPVRTDATDLRGQVDDDIRTGVIVEAFDGRFVGEVAGLAPRHDQLVRRHTASAESPANRRPQESGAPGDNDPFPREFHDRRSNPRDQHLAAPRRYRNRRWGRLGDSRPGRAD